MDIFQDIVQSLDTTKFPKVRDFDKYTLVEIIGPPSQQGKVVEARNSIGRRYAIKFYRPREGEPTALVKGVEDFNREVKMIISLNHKNIVKVHTAGRAKWEEHEWAVSHGFDTAPLKENELLFIVMDYIDGDDISKLFLSSIENGDKVSEVFRLFEDMCQQVLAAFEHLHERKVTHKDIKPDNIRYSKDDKTFILVDFGLARPFDYEPRHGAAVLTEYTDWPSIRAQVQGDEAQREKAARLNDLGQFCLVLKRLLPNFRSEYDNERYDGIRYCITKATDDDLDKRYNDVYEFSKALCPYFITSYPWKFNLSLNEYLCSGGLKKFQFCRRLRIPVSGSILIPDAIRSIIDTPEFQRLRGTKQLGPASFVFPGANHTRFEHSLGTYDLSLKYLESLINLPCFREICDPVDQSIKYIVLSALLHDIGHYTFSHWIEEIRKLPNIDIPKHESRAEEVISKSAIKEIIENQWEVDPACVFRIINNESTMDREILIHSIVEGIIGVDRVDYLIRDSVHCGIDYGRGIDVERLLGSLYVDRESKKLCLTDKGVSCLQSIISCRHVMYKEIYWHKTVRACDAMLKRLLFEYTKEGIDDPRTIYGYLSSSDDYFIKTIYNKIQNDSKYKGISKLAQPFAFSGRSLYKPAFVYSVMTSTKEEQLTQNFFQKVIGSDSYATLVDWSEILAGKLGVSPTDIIIETTPLEKEKEEPKLQDFRVWNARKRRFEKYPDELSIFNQQLDKYIQAYVFCAPEHYDHITQLALVPETGRPSKLDQIFADMYRTITSK